MIDVKQFREQGYLYESIENYSELSEDDRDKVSRNAIRHMIEIAVKKTEILKLIGKENLNKLTGDDVYEILSNNDEQQGHNCK